MSFSLSRLTAFVLLVSFAPVISVRADAAPAESQGKTIAFTKNFAEEVPGALAPDPGQSLSVWTGSPPDSWGVASIVVPPDSLPVSPKAALLISSNAATPKNCAPSITVKTALSGAGGKKTGTYRLRFAVPVEGPYRADLFFGGSWNANGAILILKDGTITLMQKMEDYKPLVIGDYATNKWLELKVVFDFAKKTYSVFLDDRQLANEIPWNSPDLASLDTLALAVGFDSKASGLPLFYLHQIELSQE